MSKVDSPSRITDYFPPSPSGEAQEKKSRLKEEITEIKPDPDCLGNKHELSNSSVILTPDSSPTKLESDVKPEVKSPSKDTLSQTKKNSSCKKCLTEDLKKTDQSTHPSKPKRRGRKKKSKKEADDQISTTTLPSPPSRPRTSRKKKTEPETLRNTLVTDYFPVRRSDRRCKSDLQKEAETDLQYKLLNGVEDGLKIEDIANKGRGVVATKTFSRGDFVVEYAGDLIDMSAAAEREKKYSQDPDTGCYMYYFNFKNRKYCIDATAESGKLGRLLNHSKTAGNCHTKLVDVKGKPYLILVASRDIDIGEELQYDYGDRSKAALESHPWLKS